MPIPNLSYVLLFVKSPKESSIFYHKILGLKPVEEAETFVLFVLPNGIHLGLWSPKTADPPVTEKAGASEICFSEDNIDSIYEKWEQMGIPMMQKLTNMDFGRTFVAQDPDGHRIRVMRLFEENR